MFTNRRDAGVQLAPRLAHYKGRPGLLVLGLPRGGVVTALEIARALSAPLDVLIVRKIGFPGEPELAAGAISETGVIVLNEKIVSYGGPSAEYIERAIALQRQEIERRIDLYRRGKKITNLAGRTIILVDDGVATGATMKAAILTLKKEKIKALVAALPVSPPETAQELRAMVDEFVCLHVSPGFIAVGQFYSDFAQVSDREVAEILRELEILTEA